MPLVPLELTVELIDGPASTQFTLLLEQFNRDLC
jgi:hypothetical protein